MKRFKAAGQAQCFLSAHDGINNLFLLRRHHVPTTQHRAAWTQAFQVWVEVTGITTAVQSEARRANRAPSRPQSNKLTVSCRVSVTFPVTKLLHRRFMDRHETGVRTDVTL